MNGLTRVALLIGIAWLLWLAFQPRVAFVIRVLKGESHLDRGIAPPGLLNEINEVCQRERIDSGTIRGHIGSGGISLVFSSKFPEGARQQLRNWWVSIHGAPTRAGRHG
jgi:hypothetical protein